jgi:hypothetical protein
VEDSRCAVFGWERGNCVLARLRFGLIIGFDAKGRSVLADRPFALFSRCFGGAVFGNLDRSGVRNAAFGEFDVEGYVVDGFTFGEFDGIAFVNGAVFFGVVDIEGFALAHADGGDFVVKPVAESKHFGNAGGMAQFDGGVVDDIDDGPFRSTTIFFKPVGNSKSVIVGGLCDFAKFNFVGDFGGLGGGLEAGDRDGCKQGEGEQNVFHD